MIVELRLFVMFEAAQKLKENPEDQDARVCNFIWSGDFYIGQTWHRKRRKLQL